MTTRRNAEKDGAEIRREQETQPSKEMTPYDIKNPATVPQVTPKTDTKRDIGRAVDSTGLGE